MLFRKNTVESVISSFQGIINDLKMIEEGSREKEIFHNEECNKAKGEADKANKLVTNFNRLIGG